jgi:oxalate decarboxylase/phosphoglucose isomerase-like protein (cupin superfamily)
MKERAMAVREPVTAKFTYDEYMAREGLPIHEAVVGVDDVTALPRAPWARTGGRGTFIQLRGTFESMRGIYIGEIPGGGALEPERHLYEKEIFILQGRGSAQVWQGDGPKLTFEWGEYSVFAIPRNAWHRLYNGGREPAIYMAVTTAPEVINALQDIDFVFNCNYEFADLYADGDQYFVPSNDRRTEKGGWYQQVNWYTHMIPDARRSLVDDAGHKVAGGQLTGYRMGDGFPMGHVSEWPAGRYHKAHYHGPGAILLGLDGEGYVLAWDSALGPRPYQSGHADQVLKVNWRKNSIYTPPNAFFHQHLNTGAGPARHIAVYGAHLPLGVHSLSDESGGGFRGYLSYREGGTLIEYEDEDPQVRKDFEAAIGAKGIECAMPPVQYR